MGGFDVQPLRSITPVEQDRASLSLLLADPSRVAEVPADLLPAVLAQCAALQSTLLARLLMERPEQCGPSDGGDSLLDVTEAAKRLMVSPDYLYRNAKRLPFTVRFGRRLRFSVRGLDRYIRQRQGR